ncbi:MAG TPA: DUF4333 domain-containing protein [Solirubrobacterales bacterium]|nr:DUF4333 domain-containing protein [Solirubrobacterales bacterium]
MDTSAIGLVAGSHRSSSIRPLAAALLAAFALLAAGCGETVIDDAKAEDAIQDSVEKSIDAKVNSVDCPADVEIVAEETFDCTVDLADGRQATALLRILSDEGDVRIVRLVPVDEGAGSGK